jgi:hypothetical protein
MKEGLNESSIVRALANKTARSITRKVIAHFQQIHDKLSGDDSELKTSWDEICVQIQHEESIFWDIYDETVRSIVAAYVTELPSYEREAIWLQTDAGIDWYFEDPQDREANPVFEDDIIDYLVRNYIYSEAEQWSNVRIRAFIDRCSRTD